MAVDEAIVNKQIKSLGHFRPGFSAAERRYIHEVLSIGENILDMIEGVIDSEVMLVAITNSRIFFLKKRMFSELEKKEIPLSDIREVSYKQGLIHGEIIIFLSEGIQKITKIHRAHVIAIAQVISGLITTQKATQDVSLSKMTAGANEERNNDSVEYSVDNKGDDVGKQREQSDTYRCPNCYVEIDQRAYVCPACNFSISEYSKNIDQTKFSNMSPEIFDERNIEKNIKELNQKESSQNTGIGCVVLILGCLALLVPVIGLFIAPVVIFVALLLLLSPDWLINWMGKQADSDSYKKTKHQAIDILENSYRNVKCPVCSNNFPSPFVIKEGEGMECDKCKKQLIAIDGKLVFIPFKESVPGKDIAKFIQEINK